MTIRDYVLAQIRHEETDFIPYELRLDRSASINLTTAMGCNTWGKDLIWPFQGTPVFFDSWPNMKSRDPNDPTKLVDTFGNYWTKTEDISHLDRIGMYGVDPRDYKWPTLEDFLWKERIEQMDRACANLSPDKFSIINLGAGHWEYIWRLLGVEEALIMTLEDPDLFDEIIEHLDVLINQFMDAMIDRPVDAFWISDDWCDQRSCLFGIEGWRKFIKPRLAKLYKKAHDAGKIVINHVCGNVDPLLPDLVEIGLDVLESVQSEAMDIYKMKKLYGDKITFFGALGVQNLVNFGTPDQIRDEIRKLRREMGKGGGFILAPAKPLNRTVPGENLRAIYETFIEDNYKFL